MGRGTRGLTDEQQGSVYELGVKPPEKPPGPPPRSSRLHSIAVLITALSAVLAIGSGAAFLTVNWSGEPRRVVIAVLMASIVLFWTGVVAAILTAARDTYVKTPGS